MEMLREKLNDSLKAALKSGDKRSVSTVRMILAAVKDRDIAARGKGNADGIADADILQVLQSMVKQRQESIKLYQQGGRPELAQQEADEIGVIEGFMPRQMSEAETAAAIKAVAAELGGEGIKGMGRGMALLRERHAGQMDFTKASALLKDALSKPA
jgi:hypothetical protein